MTTVELRGIRKGYGENCVIRDACCSLGTGIHLIEGANGAGKTTLLDMIAGICKPTCGKVIIGGLEIEKHRKRCMASIAFAPARTLFFDGVSVEFAVRLFFSLRGRSIEHDVFHDFDPFGLRRYANVRFGDLSLGWQKRVILHMVMGAKADVLILDEPTIGLDLEAVGMLGELMRCRDKHGTTILTCHDPRSLALSNYRQYVLERRGDGSVLLAGRPGNISANQ
ncbi:ABC transporter ATP-binding protein [Luteibacter sp. E-22]|uniref:ABC transporter ATP-binding protein n=1 Tax=Luteibacter sp. E-22 TaxID=3404050 RepID=UPI003CEE3F9E